MRKVLENAKYYLLTLVAVVAVMVCLMPSDGVKATDYVDQIPSTLTGGDTVTFTSAGSNYCFQFFNSRLLKCIKIISANDDYFRFQKIHPKT